MGAFMSEAPITSVYLNRGPAGFEAFSAVEKSLGLFTTQQAAAAAIMRGPP